MPQDTRRFAVFDIDGTLIRWQMLHAIFDALGRAEHLNASDFDLLKQARRAWKVRKSEEEYLAYEMTLVDIVLRNITSLAVTDFNHAVDQVFEKYKDQTYRYTRQLIKQCKADGYTLLAISGSPEEIVAKIADYYGFDDYVGTKHVRKNGRFTGEIIVASHHKPELLNTLITKHHLDFAGSIGVGDSEGDIGMLELVQHPIAFNPSQKLFRHAEANRWNIVVERKNLIYELEAAGDGYRLARTNA